jgi:hypothetical protein
MFVDCLACAYEALILNLCRYFKLVSRSPQMFADSFSSCDEAFEFENLKIVSTRV